MRARRLSVSAAGIQPRTRTMSAAHPAMSSMSNPPTPPRHVVREEDVEWTAVRAQGPGGQNVNKVSSAVHLRFNVAGSSLPDDVKQRLLQRSDQRLTSNGVIVIKAQASRSQEANRAEALARLQALVDQAGTVPKVRKATRPTLGSQQRRLEAKSVRAQVKALRGKGFD